MHLVNTLAPTVEPLSLTDAKLHCRVDITHDDSLISAYITSARRLIEAYCLNALMTQHFTVTYDYCDTSEGLWVEKQVIRLPMQPIISLTTITTYDSDNNATVFDSSNYRLSGNRIVLNDNCYWPSNLRSTDCLQIDFVAGYGATADSVPLDIVQAMKLLVAQWYENREAISDPVVIKDKAGGALSYAVTALLSAYRTIVL